MALELNQDLSQELFDTPDLKKWPLDQRIGQGAFGDAFLVIDPKTRKKYVLKRVRMARQNDWQRGATKQEIKLGCMLQHPFIVRFMKSWIRDGHEVNIVYGYCELGDLQGVMKKQKNKHIEEQQLRRWLAQLLLALHYLQGKHVLHRDLKSSNIFVTADNDVQIGDFGLATIGSQDDSSTHDQSIVGTPHFMSPELLNRKKYDYKTDVWSLGCVAYELSSLRPAFNAFNLNGLVSKICKSAVAPLPSQYSEEWGAMIKWMLKKDAAKRPSVEELLSSLFLREDVAWACQRAQQLHPGVELPPFVSMVQLLEIPRTPGPSCGMLEEEDDTGTREDDLHTPPRLTAPSACRMRSQRGVSAVAGIVDGLPSTATNAAATAATTETIAAAASAAAEAVVATAAAAEAAAADAVTTVAAEADAAYTEAVAGAEAEGHNKDATDCCLASKADAASRHVWPPQDPDQQKQAVAANPAAAELTRKDSVGPGYAVVTLGLMEKVVGKVDRDILSVPAAAEEASVEQPGDSRQVKAGLGVKRTRRGSTLFAPTIASAMAAAARLKPATGAAHAARGAGHSRDGAEQRAAATLDSTAAGARSVKCRVSSSNSRPTPATFAPAFAAVGSSGRPAPTLAAAATAGGNGRHTPAAAAGSSGRLAAAVAATGLHGAVAMAGVEPVVCAVAPGPAPSMPGDAADSGLYTLVAAAEAMLSCSNSNVSSVPQPLTTRSKSFAYTRPQRQPLSRRPAIHGKPAPVCASTAAVAAAPTALSLRRTAAAAPTYRDAAKAAGLTRAAVAQQQTAAASVAVVVPGLPGKAAVKEGLEPSSTSPSVTGAAAAGAPYCAAIAITDSPSGKGPDALPPRSPWSSNSVSLGCRQGSAALSSLLQPSKTLQRGGGLFTSIGASSDVSDISSCFGIAAEVEPEQSQAVLPTSFSQETELNHPELALPPPAALALQTSASAESSGGGSGPMTHIRIRSAGRTTSYEIMQTAAAARASRLGDTTAPCSPAVPRTREQQFLFDNQLYQSTGGKSPSSCGDGSRSLPLRRMLLESQSGLSSGRVTADGAYAGLLPPTSCEQEVDAAPPGTSGISAAEDLPGEGHRAAAGAAAGPSPSPGFAGFGPHTAPVGLARPLHIPDDATPPFIAADPMCVSSLPGSDPMSMSSCAMSLGNDLASVKRMLDLNDCGSSDATPADRGSEGSSVERPRNDGGGGGSGGSGAGVRPGSLGSWARGPPGNRQPNSVHARESPPSTPPLFCSSPALDTQAAAVPAATGDSGAARLLMLERVVSLAARLHTAGRWQELGTVLSSAQTEQSGPFAAPPAPSAFARSSSSTLGAESPSSSLARQSAQKQKARLVTATSKGLRLGDLVIVGSRRGMATVRYFGPCHWAEGEHVGLELERAEGQSAGVVDGIVYFHCRAMHGVFVKAGTLKPDSKAGSRGPSKPGLT